MKHLNFLPGHAAEHLGRDCRVDEDEVGPVHLELGRVDVQLPETEQGADLVAGEDVPVFPAKFLTFGSCHKNSVTETGPMFATCTVPIAFGHGKSVGVRIVGKNVVCAAFVGGVHGEAQGPLALLGVGELHRRKLRVGL